MSATELTREQILEGVARSVRDVIDEDWIDEVEITTETSFAHDLELESVEVVALAERLHDRFGGELDLAVWFGSMELEESLELKVGQLVDFIAESTGAASES